MREDNPAPILRVRLSDDEMEGLATIAKGRRTTMSALVREALYDKYPQLMSAVSEGGEPYEGKPDLVKAVSSQVDAINRLIKKMDDQQTAPPKK